MACLAVILLCGCNDQGDSLSWMEYQNLPQIDSSRIQKGRLENLDDLMGIDYFRIGTKRRFYRRAFPSDSSYRHSDTCRMSFITIRSLKMTVYREASVESFPGRDNSEHFLHSNYYASLLLQ